MLIATILLTGQWARARPFTYMQNWKVQSSSSRHIFCSIWVHASVHDLSLSHEVVKSILLCWKHSLFCCHEPKCILSEACGFMWVSINTIRLQVTGFIRFSFSVFHKPENGKHSRHGVSNLLPFRGSPQVGRMCSFGHWGLQGCWTSVELHWR